MIVSAFKKVILIFFIIVFCYSSYSQEIDYKLGINARFKLHPSSSSNTINRLKKGAVIKILSNGQKYGEFGGYYAVRYKNQSGYINDIYINNDRIKKLKNIENPENFQELSTALIITKKNASLRKSPTGFSDEIMIIPKGEIVQSIARGEKYYKVKYNETVGYIFTLWTKRAGSIKDIEQLSKDSSPEITNVEVAQENNSVIIQYDLEGDGTYYVEIYYSTNDSETWKGPLTQVEGAVGEKQIEGNNKEVIWNVLDEQGEISGYYQFQVLAELENQFPLDSGIFSDERDGQVYKWIKIGEQIWMAENLKTIKYNDGTSIPNVTDNENWTPLSSGAYCWYKNDIGNKAIYGALYNWHAVNTGKLCPEGWHVPSDAEWIQLENFLADNGYNYDGTIGGGRSKIAKSIASTTHWNSSSNTGAIGSNLSLNNESYFSALPGGYRTYSDGTFYNVGYYGSWWSSPERESSHVWRRGLGCYHANVHRYYGGKAYGLGVRCVRD
jgi:uncharacterized protein (TIGR02145 family)